jgi:hypothetical protein
MKKLIIFCVAVAIQVVACKSEVNSQDGLVGRWRLTEYCKLDQSNNCTVIEVSQQETVLIEFTSDNKYFEKYSKTPPQHRFLGCGNGNYEVTNAELGFYLPCSSSLAPRKVQIVKQGDNQLILNTSTSGLKAGEFKFARL